MAVSVFLMWHEALIGYIGEVSDYSGGKQTLYTEVVNPSILLSDAEKYYAQILKG